MGASRIKKRAAVKQSLITALNQVVQGSKEKESRIKIGDFRDTIDKTLAIES